MTAKSPSQSRHTRTYDEQSTNVVKLGNRNYKKVEMIPRNTAQEEYVEALLEKRMVFAVGPAGTGKAQPLHSKIKIPNGWTTMNDIKVGDKVSTPNGGTANVIGIYPQGKKEIYTITFTDGRTAECCKEHLWEVFYPDNWGDNSKILSLDDIIKLQNKFRKKLQVRLINHENIDDINLPIDPYLLGCLLGDGNISIKGRISFSSSDVTIVEKLNKIIPDGEFIHKSNYDYVFKSGGKGSGNKLNKFGSRLRDELSNLNLFGTKSNNKFIPEIYLNSSKEQKIKMLQGLLDTDGYADKKNNGLYFTSVSKIMAEQVQYLVRSIGGTAKITSKTPSFTYKGIKKYGQVAYDVKIDYNCKTDLVSLDRKKQCLKNNGQYIKNNRIGISKIEYTSIAEAQCIMIDSPDHLYITDNFVVTHNTLLAVLRAIKALREQEISKIILTRPAVSVDEKHGFLPGDLNAKMEPWTRPIFDVFEEYYGLQETKRMLDEGTIEIAPLGFMRGRTFKYSYIIADEMQNATPDQTKMLLTRIGDGSSMVITGDLKQHDRGFDKNGLKDFLERLAKNNTCSMAVCTFRREHIERDPLVAEVLKIYGEDE
jgi:phosphate starvation-inducible protein PhoH